MSTVDSASAEHHAPPPTHVDLGDVSIAIVRWPEEQVLRDALAAIGRARLLAVSPGAIPPTDLDACEDWLRWPADKTELALRASHLRQRTRGHRLEPVLLDDDGVLRRGGRWVAISDAQLPVIRLLLDHVDRVVRFDDIVEAYAAGGGSRHPASIRTVVSRLGERIRPLGLTITNVRRRGVVLRSADLPGPVPR